MPEMIYLRDQWRMSRSTPLLRALGRKSALDFLSKAKSHHEQALSDHFGEEVTIDKIERHLAKNMEFDVECAILQAIAAQRQLADQVAANTRLEQQARELASQVCM